MDPNPAGTKTYGSYGSGSEYGSATMRKKSKQVFGIKLIESGSGLFGEPRRFLITKNGNGKYCSWEHFLKIKVAIYFFLCLHDFRTFMLHEKPPVFQREQPELQNINYVFIFLKFYVIFAYFRTH
jgi:hypothetical protein